MYYVFENFISIIRSSSTIGNFRQAGEKDLQLDMTDGRSLALEKDRDKWLKGKRARRTYSYANSKMIQMHEAI